MESKNLEALIQSQREFLHTGKTRDLTFRREMIMLLDKAIRDNEARIFQALKADLNKPPFEAFAGEIAFVYEEIKYTLKHFERWARPKKAPTPLVSAVGRSRVYFEPLGVVLIIGPWNYPFQLVVSPLVGAMAAGNCAVLKPSELAPQTSAVIAKIISANFDSSYLAVAEGGVETSTELLNQKFDHIFYTGGAAVGRVVMQAAAKHLTPVTLELGGKSPCIIDDDLDLAVTAKRIAWGKYYNAGQTCVAPDYLLVKKSVKESLLKAMRESVETFFGADPSQSPDYARIINQRHFQRLKSLLPDRPIFMGGITKADSLYIAPTILSDARWDDKVMAEEIFGPLLPVIEYEELSQAIEWVNAHPKPLALYFFSRNRERQDRVLAETSFGGGCINDTLVHVSSPHIPFGGVGESGMGAYHGQYSFETFSHRKSVIHRSFFPDMKLRYPPYQPRYLKWLRRLMG